MALEQFPFRVRDEEARLCLHLAQYLNKRRDISRRLPGACGPDDERMGGLGEGDFELSLLLIGPDRGAYDIRFLQLPERMDAEVFRDLLFALETSLLEVGR